MDKSDLSIVKVQGENRESAIFQLDGEDHTLGNALRFTICRNKDVKFCAYSIPHPNDRKVLMQIQVYPGRGSAVQALEKGLRDLLDVSQHVESVFRAECERFQSEAK